jgi:hypothetical protein
MRAPSLAALAAVLALAGPVSAQTVQITTNVGVNTTWGPTGTVVGSVFWVRNSMAINAGVTLIIQPGVVVKFDPGTSLTTNGALRAIGTPAQNIIFTSVHDDAVGGDTNGNGNLTVPNASDWGGIRFPDATTDFATRLDYADVRFAGYSQTGALAFTSSSDSVTNSVIRRSYYGLDCAGSAAPVMSNTTIEASTLTPIVLDFTAAPVFSSLVFSTANNGYDAFGLRGATLTSGQNATLPKRGATVGANPVANVTYVLLGSLTINPGASLSIDPGVVIKPSGSYFITVSGTLNMNGTAATGDTITITSIHDDNFGLPGDTDNNGSISAPARGDWNRIVYLPGSTGSISRCRLKFGTNSATQGVIEMTNNSIAVSNSLISDAGHGLAILGISSPTITNVAINNCSSTPIYMSVSANPTFAGVTFLANAITALGLDGENIAVDSRIALRSVAGFTNITYYLMNGQLVMQSPAILRIDPGVVIKNQPGGGGFQIDGGLIADGKPDSLIVFTSDRDDLYGNPPDTNGDGSITTPAVGNWTYIHFTATSNDAVSKLDNCRVTYGSNSVEGGVWCTSAAPTITSTVFSKLGYGVRADGDGSPTISQCDFNNLTNAPILMSAIANPTIATNNVYSTNGYNALALLSETLSQTARIRYRPGVGTPTFAYLPIGTITVASGVTLSIEPQVVIKPSSTFTVFTVNGALNVVGSNNTTGRVVFTSRRDDNPAYGGDTTPSDATTPQAGDWSGILFNDTSVDGSCVIRNALFQFGGQGGNEFGTITTASASPRLVNLEFFQNVSAMTFGGNSQPVVDSTSILNCTNLPITFSLTSNPQFPAPARIVLANNAFTCLGLFGETIVQDVRTGVRALGSNPNIAYCPTGNITIGFGAKWTIDPGVVIKLGRVFADPTGSSIFIDGALVADGKPDSLIIFTSSADDAFGGDIKGDGAATQPASQQWGSIQFNAISNDVATVIDNCRFRYGGYSASAPLRFISSGPTVTNCVTTASYYGLWVEGNATPTFTNVNVDSCTNVPVYMSLVSNPTFNNVQFLGDAYTALGVLTESIAQDVRWPIRAVAGRNNMPWLLQGTLTVGLGATLTIQPGVIVKSNGGVIDVQRAFQAEGRVVEPESLIVFTSYRDDFYGGDTNNDGALSAPAASDWSSVSIEGTAIDPQVRFKNCVLRYGGSGATQGAIRCINSAPSVDSCLISGNTVGISVEGQGNPTVHHSSFFGNTQFAINSTSNPPSFCVDATLNWWGSAGGPRDTVATTVITPDLCAMGMNFTTGDKVSNNVNYSSFTTGGLLNPLLGDVSLNGQVLAYDASLVLQYAVALISLTPLQLSVADVSGVGGVTAGDASLILQYVAGVIPAFPAISNLNSQPTGDIAAARAVLARMGATADVSLGTPVRDADGWRVPVRLDGAGDVFALELALEGGSVAALTAFETQAQGAIAAQRVGEGEARAALAGVTPFGRDEIAWLRFAGTGGTFVAPRLAWARVNEQAADRPAPAPAGPKVSFAAPPTPNPARDRAVFRIGVAQADAGAAGVRVVDVTGRAVRTLIDGALEPGVRDLVWNLADDAGRSVPAGLYFLRVDVGSLHATHRLIVVR